MKIALLGDIGLFSRFSKMTANEFSEYYESYIDLVSDCDYVIGNLEVPFSNAREEFTAKSACIAACPSDQRKLSLLKLTHVNLANNHTGDYGREGYDLTIEILNKLNIEYFGIAGKQSFINTLGNKIALTGFCNMDSNPVYLYKHDEIGDKGINVANVPEIISTLLKNHQSGYLNILSFHSGLEHVHLPGLNDIKFTRLLSNIVPYIHYGHHPHVVQGYEKINSSHIFYSLGNFCFDDVYNSTSSKPLVKMSEQNKVCMIPILTIEKNEVQKVDFYWFRISEDKFEVLDPENNKLIQKVIHSLTNRSLESIHDERSDILKRYIKDRKSSRDIKWYLNRLNKKYVKLYLNTKRNLSVYRSNYANYLKHF